VRREGGREGEEEEEGEEGGRGRLRRWERRSCWAVELVPKMMLCVWRRVGRRGGGREVSGRGKWNERRADWKEKEE